jgi:hypothetical protein
MGKLFYVVETKFFEKNYSFITLCVYVSSILLCKL